MGHALNASSWTWILDVDLHGHRTCCPFSTASVSRAWHARFWDMICTPRAQGPNFLFSILGSDRWRADNLGFEVLTVKVPIFVRFGYQPAVLCVPTSGVSFELDSTHLLVASEYGRCLAARQLQAFITIHLQIANGGESSAA